MGARYLFSHAIGCVALNDKFSAVDSSLSTALDGKTEQLLSLQKKYPSAITLSYPQHKKEIAKALPSLLGLFEKARLREINILLTKKTVKESTTDDILIIQAVKSVGDVDNVLNSLSNRLRDWYGLYLPEYSRAEPDNFAFVLGAATLSKEEYLQKEKIESFGSNLSEEHIDALKAFSLRIRGLQDAREELLHYIDSTMQGICPNLRAIAGPLLGGKLLEHAGSLRRLMEMPSSTIQILGAEKALFRHLRSGAKPPKYGILLGHELVQNAPRQRQGRAARILSDKISLAVKIDYFQGEFLGDSLLLDAKKKIRQ